MHDSTTVSSGSLALDLALGAGGFPRGKIVEIYGPACAGKTTLALQTIADVQRNGGTAAFIDAEYALDTAYARKLGVDMERLVVSRPKTGEQGMAIADMLLRSGTMDLIAIDSVAALLPEGERRAMPGSQPGLHIRLVTHGVTRLSASAFSSKTAVLIINHLRIETQAPDGTAQQITTGGEALKRYASIRLDIRRVGAIVDRGQIVGDKAHIKVVKNIAGRADGEARLDILYGTGIDREDALLNEGTRYGVLEKAGGGFRYHHICIGASRKDAGHFLQAHPRVGELIDREIRQAARDRKTPDG